MKTRCLVLFFCFFAQPNLFGQAKQEENQGSPARVKSEMPQTIRDSFLGGVVGVRFFGTDKNRKRISVDGGTGFVVAKNHVLTCFHIPAEERNGEYFLENPESIEVEIFDRNEIFAGKIFAFDKEKDLLLIKITGSQNKPFNKKILLPSTKKPQEDPEMTFFVFAFANKTFQFSFKLGTFKEYINDEKLTLHKKELGIIEKSIAPGYSGSPILDDKGMWIGVARASWNHRGGLTLFVPQDQILEFLKEAYKNSPQRQK